MVYLPHFFSVFIFTHILLFSFAQETSTVLSNTLKLSKKANCQNNGETSGSWKSEDDNYLCAIKIEEGFQIKIIIEKFYINSTDLTRVIIKPAESITSDGKNIVLTWNVTEKEIVFPTNQIKMELIKLTDRQWNDYEGFSIHWEQYGNKTEPTQQPSSTENYPTLDPNSKETYYYTVYLSGKLPNEFIKDVGKFKELLSTKANEYCNKNNIDLKEKITISNVNITLAIQCLYLWPNADKCVEVHYAIPTIVNNSDVFELSYAHLEGIWISISDADLYKSIGWKNYSSPNDNFTLTLWLLVCFAIVFIALSIFLGLKFLSGIKFSRRKDSTVENIEAINQFPIPFQNTPQMFEENPYQYQEMRAHTNQAFVFEDLSDDERFDIRHRSSESIQR